RLYPPAFVIGREAVDDCEVGGYAIPRGMTILMSPWIMQRDPRFHERPEEFVPERWERNRASRVPRFAYFPFGGGPRRCIGDHFALMETVLVLATLAQRFHFTLATSEPIVPTPTFTLRPGGGVPAIVRQRKGAPSD